MEPHLELLLKNLLPPPVECRHREYSMIFSADDEQGKPTGSLLTVALRAVQEAAAISLSHVSARMAQPPFYPDIWPGEHYRLLAGLVKVMQPQLVIEIGTGGGLSALSMLTFLPQTSKLITFDLTPAQQDPRSFLRASDFQDHRFVQHVADLSDTQTALPYFELLASAQLIFIDAQKDGSMELRLLQILNTIPFSAPTLLVLDDIRLWNMLRTWRLIHYPKLDLTSFGHWSGTGLVEWGRKQ